MTAPTFCTILARNYLPKALALSESLSRHGSEKPLVVFLIDATPETDLPEIAGVRWMYPALLGLPQRQMLNLAMGYDLVEFATAVKPLVLQNLLRESEAVVYLDPDTYVTSPMIELGPALEASAGILLTPHYLEPTPPGSQFSEGHLLHVGVYNLGFCAVNRNADEFLTWWWGHLRTECLHDPIAGLFVDQKWVDLGSVLFGAAGFQHYGYNVGVGNLHERRIAHDSDGYYIGSTGDRLRLFHFHAFDPNRPEELSTRFDASTAHLRADNEGLDALCKEYADIVIGKQQQIGPHPTTLRIGHHGAPYHETDAARAPCRGAGDARWRPVAVHRRRVSRVRTVAAPCLAACRTADALRRRQGCALCASRGIREREAQTSGVDEVAAGQVLGEHRDVELARRSVT